MAAVYGDDSFPRMEDSSSSGASTPQGSSTLGPVNVFQFFDYEGLQRIVITKTSDLREGRSKIQHIIFKGVSRDDFDYIDCHRNIIGKGTRMRYHLDESLLIVKLMPSELHEMAHRDFEFMFRRRLVEISSPRMLAVGAKQCTGLDGSLAEADGVYIPSPPRSANDWPTLVVEVGVSESLAALQRDAHWWLTQSGGEVRIVLIMSLSQVRQARSIVLMDKWENTTPVTDRPYTRSVTRQQNRRCVHEIRMTRDTVIGAPLVLEFEKLFLRAPVPPETDLIFTAQDLSEMASCLW